MSDQIDLTTPRNCTRCKGEGTTFHRGYPDRTDTCYRCKGARVFPGLDVKTIVDALFSTRGPNNGKFRKSLTSNQAFGDYQKARIYYVWRMVRFDIGADVTMPMTASMVISGDPFSEELDALASIIAKHISGHKVSVGAARWGQALGFATGPTPAGLPNSAYEGGPVCDDNKPGWERLELK